MDQSCLENTGMADTPKVATNPNINRIRHSLTYVRVATQSIAHLHAIAANSSQGELNECNPAPWYAFIKQTIEEVLRLPGMQQFGHCHF